MTPAPDATPTPPVAPVQNINLADFGIVIGEAVAKGIAANTRRKVTFGEYDPRTFVQPDKRLTLKLKRNCYQNSGMLQPSQLSNEEIGLLNRITHSGRYIDRIIEVIVNADSSEETVDIRYNNKTMEQRFEIKGRFKNFADMLKQIVDVQEMEDLEETERLATKAAVRASKR